MEEEEGKRKERKKERGEEGEERTLEASMPFHLSRLGSPYPEKSYWKEGEDMSGTTARRQRELPCLLMDSARLSRIRTVSERVART